MSVRSGGFRQGVNACIYLTFDTNFMLCLFLDSTARLTTRRTPVKMEDSWHEHLLCRWSRKEQHRREDSEIMKDGSFLVVKDYLIKEIRQDGNKSKVLSNTNYK